MPSQAPGPLGGTWILDLDGVIWLAGEPIPGSADAVARLRAAGIGVVFASNNSAPRLGELVDRLGRAGIDADPGELVTSAQAAAGLLAPGTNAFPCAEDGVVEALTSRGVAVAGSDAADAVIVGWNRHFDFELLSTATALIRGGARFIGTNEDATYPTPDGLLPGAGSILAAVATASQTSPEVAGKPHPPMVDLLRARVPDARYVVGDRPATDGRLAERLGVPFAHVRSGVTRDGREPMVVTPDEQADDLAGLVDRLVGG